VGKKGTKDYERLLLGVEIPLLRNARINAKLAAERKARLQQPLAEAELQSLRLRIFHNAGVKYWKWVASVRAYAVAEEMAALAQTRAQAIADQVEHGGKPTMVLIEAKREVEKRLGVLAKATRNLQKTCLALSLYLWDEDGNPSELPDHHLAPLTFPPAKSLSQNEVRSAEERALKIRPGLGAIDLQEQIQRIDLSLARNEGRPDLSVFFHSGKGVGFDVFEPVERRLRAGFKVSVPLRRRSPRGKSSAARLKLQKLDLQTKLLQQRIRIQVRDAASRIQTDQQRLQAANQELALALSLEKSERTRFEVGGGTLFLVNQRERYRAQAQIKAIEVCADYHQAQLAFLAAIGELSP
jgi:outer membrane protein TolC